MLNEDSSFKIYNIDLYRKEIVLCETLLYRIRDSYNNLDNDGEVVGAAFDDNMKLKHIAVSKKEDLDKLSVSELSKKYVKKRPLIRRVLSKIKRILKKLLNK